MLPFRGHLTKYSAFTVLRALLVISRALERRSSGAMLPFRRHLTKYVAFIITRALFGVAGVFERKASGQAVFEEAPDQI